MKIFFLIFGPILFRLHNPSEILQNLYKCDILVSYSGAEFEIYKLTSGAFFRPMTVIQDGLVQTKFSVFGKNSTNSPWIRNIWM